MGTEKRRESCWVWGGAFLAVATIVGLNIHLLGLKRAYRALQLQKGDASSDPVVQKRLYSFTGSDNSGTRHWVHFNAYQDRRFLLIRLSPDCGSCLQLLNDIVPNDLDGVRSLQTFILSSERLDKPCPLPLLEVSRDDIMQVGMRTPTLVYCNGQGDVLLRAEGWHPAIWTDFVTQIKTMERKR